MDLRKILGHRRPGILFIIQSFANRHTSIIFKGASHAGSARMHFFEADKIPSYKTLFAQKSPAANSQRDFFLINPVNRQEPFTL